MLDETPLPALVADYRGFAGVKEGDMLLSILPTIFAAMSRELARRLQERFFDLTTEASVGLEHPAGSLAVPQNSQGGGAKSGAPSENARVLAALLGLLFAGGAVAAPQGEFIRGQLTLTPEALEMIRRLLGSAFADQE